MVRHLLMAGAFFIGAGTLTATAETASKAEHYISCTFRPQASSCAAVYQEAINDPDPGALSVRDAYEHYGRYVLAAKGQLTEKDRRYLKDNGIALPPSLDASDLAGLDAVINDPTIKDDETRRLDVNGFLDRAIEAELYCGFNACGARADTQTQEAELR